MAQAWHEAWIGDMLPLDTPLMRALFDIQAMHRSSLFPRFCNLAYSAHDLGVSDLAD